VRFKTSGGAQILKTVRERFNKVNEVINLLQLDTILNYSLFYGSDGKGKAVGALGGVEKVRDVLRMRHDWHEEAHRNMSV